MVVKTISGILFSSHWGKFWPKGFKIGLFLKQKYEIFRGFFEIFRKCFGTLEFPEDIWAALRDICVKAYLYHLDLSAVIADQ